MICLLVIALCLLYVVSLIREHMKNGKRRLPPGPIGFPFIGSLPFLDIYYMHESFMDLSKKYGEMFSIRIGSRLAVIVNSHKTIKNVLVKQEFAGRPQMFPLTHFPQGNFGVVASTGPLWVEQRRFALRHMKELGMGKSSMEDLILNDVKFFTDDLKVTSADTEQPTDISAMLNLAILSATWHILTGQQVGYKDKWFTEMSDGIGFALPEFLFKSSFAVFFPTISNALPASWLLTENYVKLEGLLGKYLKEILEEHKRTYDENNIRDFIDIYITELNKKKNETGHFFSDWQMHATIADMFVGSVETTPTTLRWGILLMAMYPHIQTKVQKEIDDVIGRNRQITTQDRYSLKYTEAVLCEIQRVGSVTPLGIVHEAEADGTVDGYDIPKGTIILSNLWANHRDEKHWKYPWEFYPEHFLDKDGNHIPSQEGFLPFSTGKRSCLGKGIAKMELFLFFANFLQNFSVRMPGGVNIPLVSPPLKAAVRGCPDYQVLLYTRK